MAGGGRSDDHAEIGGDRVLVIPRADVHLERSGCRRSPGHFAGRGVKRESWRESTGREVHRSGRVRDDVSVVERSAYFAVVQRLGDKTEIRATWKDKKRQNRRGVVPFARIIG